MQKAVIYARFSSDKQREESIEGQIRECKAFAAANDITVVGTYIDRAMTARTDRRPDFQKMIKDSEKSIFNYIIVYQLDRFARSRYDSAIYKNRLKKNGVKVLSAKENIKDDPSGIILESVLEGYAEYYSAELAQKVLRGMTENVLEGKWPGGPIPLGYKLDDQKRVILDAAGAQCVKMIYAKCIEGWTLKKIIGYLNDHQYKTSTSRKFSRSSLDAILRNKMYLGEYSWKGLRFPAAIPAIIDQDIYDKIQRIIQRRKNRTAASRSAIYNLTGKLFCGQCGGSMIGMSGTSETGNRYFYYICLHKSHDKTCTAKNIRRDAIEDFVLCQTVSLLNNKEAVQLIADQAMAVLKKDAQNDIETDNITAQITDISARLKNCMESVDKGLVTESIINHIKEHEAALKELQSAKEIASRKAEAITITVDHVKFFLEQMLQGDHEKTDAYRDRVFSTFIRQVIVYEDYIEIFYNYKNEPPILPESIRINSSSLTGMVGANRIELLTSCL